MGKRWPPNPSPSQPSIARGSSQTAHPDIAVDQLTDSARAGSADGVERVADRAHSAQQIGAAGAVERLAQPPDMDIDGAHLDLGIVAPYPVEQLLAREHAAGMLQKMAQQAVFGRPEMDRLSG